MAERIDLPEGEWVIFRDPKVMTNRQRRPYMDLLFKMQNGKWRPDEDAESAWKWGAASTFMLIAKWSLEQEITADYDLWLLTLEDLPVSFVDSMMLEVSRYLMRESEILAESVPPTKRARPAKVKQPST